MDPLSVTMTVVTLATFIKDLIDVGQNIKRSIDKVSENRRQIRDVADDILRVLAEMAELSRGHEGQSQAPALLSALEDLRADMLYVLSACRKIIPAQRSPGLRGFGSQIKVRMKRDDIEAKIRRLKEHVNKCYLEFTAFSAARIEVTTHRTDNTTLRVEQSLIVNHVENQVKLQRLEGMMARVLLETQFGQDVMNRTMEIIASGFLKDAAHHTIEFQYISAQALRLVDSLQQLQLAAISNSTLAPDTPLSDVTTLVLIKPVSATHVLYNILALTIQIEDSPAEIVFAYLQTIIRIGAFLSNLRMNSEAIAWYRMTIQILRRFSGAGFHSNSRVLSNLALSSLNLSCRYQNELRWDLAVETSQQAMDFCRLWQELFPDLDYRPLLSGILITHSENLRVTSQLEDSISNAEEPVAVCRGMVGESIDSGSAFAEYEWKAATFLQAFFTLVAAHASADRHLAAYEAANEGFRTLLRFPTGYPPSGTDIDISIDQLCRVAEENGLSLGMLADVTVLFRDLARLYPDIFAPHFLRILRAYAYLCQQHSPDFSSLRLFLEPGQGSPLPLDVSSNLELYIEHFDSYGGVIEDVIRAYPWDTWRDVAPLIKDIFGAKFQQAMSALYQITSQLIINPQSNPKILDWILDDVSNEILPLVTRSQQLVLMEIMAKIVEHLRTVTTTSPPPTECVLVDFSHGLWQAGLLDDAKRLCDEGEYLWRSRKNEDPAILSVFLMRRTFILWDMGEIPQAMEAAHKVKAVMEASPANVLHHYMIWKRILERTGRNWEALKLLSHVDAERALAVCRGEVDEYVDQQQYALVHCLTTLSNCLAAVGRNDEALGAARESTSIYILQAPIMRASYLYALRKEELGAHAFHTLSLRLTTSGELERALLNAEKATELYRESVSLAPRLLPTLASSLQNLASILWNVGRRDEGISACDGAVSIMWKVADNETYFLRALGNALDQLSRYVDEKGDIERAAAARSESSEVRWRIELLPPEPQFLFSDIETECDDDDDDDRDWETATESENETHKPSDATTDIDVVVSEAARLAFMKTVPSTETQIEQSEVSTEGADSSKGLQAVMEEVPVVSQAENRVSEDTTAKPVTSPPRATDILSTPLELKLQLRSTPMDIIWWSLVAVLGVTLAAVWSRG
ncbi:hypothetical protein DFH09DRAFT_1285981 [Mycena vulgaris]|nr:hypothetical protein DFH09DRAFT_1285981 [Mycena vulgaris]